MILNYFDEQIERHYKINGGYPEKLEVSSLALDKIEKAIENHSPTLDDCWVDFKTNGRLNNYKGIPIEIKEGRNE